VHDNILKVYKPLVQFFHIYNFGAVGDRDRLIGFWKVSGQGHSKTTYGQIGIFSPVSVTHVHNSVKLIPVTHYHVHMTLMTFGRWLWC